VEPAGNRAPLSFEIERVAALPDLAELLEASLAEGHGLIRRTISEFDSGKNRFDRAGEALYVARDASRRFVGICGLNIDPYLNDPAVGRVRHLYVLPPYRRAGVARALLDVVMTAARGRFRLLRIRTKNPAADALYRSAGFTVVAADDLVSHQTAL
jgi:GNAT superfamily N-acetyltransferase